MNARKRSNPFEAIKKSIFQNRAALKMAEMDRICDRLFTGPGVALDAKGQRQLVRFADICAGPGGFSEYMLTQLKWRAKVCVSSSKSNTLQQMVNPTVIDVEILVYFAHKDTHASQGFGFTLVGDLDFKVHKFNKNAPHESFKAYYGEDNTGDITKACRRPLQNLNGSGF